MNIDINGPDKNAVEIAKHVLFAEGTVSVSPADVIQLAENVIRFHAATERLEQYIEFLTQDRSKPESAPVSVAAEVGPNDRSRKSSPKSSPK